MGDIPVTPLPSVRIAQSFKQLANAATALKAATDEFSKVTAPLDELLQRLNLGVECWVRFRTWTYEDGTQKFHEVGYAKINGRWGVALRSIQDDDPTGAEYTSIDKWAYNEGPRTMRVDAVQKFPELLDELVKKADKHTRKLKEGTDTAREVIDALEKAAAEAGIIKAKKGAAK
jgi:hypothetical protein